jgi:hypothetical protein
MSNMRSERDRLLKGWPRGIVWGRAHPARSGRSRLPPHVLLIGAIAGTVTGALMMVIGVLALGPVITSLQPEQEPTLSGPAATLTESPTQVIAALPQDQPTVLPTRTTDWPTLVPTSTPRPTYTSWPTHTPHSADVPAAPPPTAAPGTLPDSGGIGATATPIFGLTPQPIFTLGVIFPQTPGAVGTPAPTPIILPPNAILFVRNSNVSAIGPDGRGLMQLTDGPRRNLKPTWSPDRRRIAFYSDRDGNLEIYVMALDGASSTRITADPAPDSHPAWAWTSDLIAFDSARSGGGDIYTMNASGGDVTRVTGDGAVDHLPCWSPAGGRIVFASNRDGGDNDLFVVNADGSGLTQLTNNQVDDTYPAWSPDGTRLAYASAGDLHILDIASGGVQRLTTLGTVGSLSWSPSGRQIVFSAGGDLWLIDATGGTPVRLTSGAAQDIDPAWAR